MTEPDLTPGTRDHVIHTRTIYQYNLNRLADYVRQAQRDSIPQDPRYIVSIADGLNVAYKRYQNAVEQWKQAW